MRMLLTQTVLASVSKLFQVIAMYIKKSTLAMGANGHLWTTLQTMWTLVSMTKTQREGMAVCDDIVDTGRCEYVTTSSVHIGRLETCAKSHRRRAFDVCEHSANKITTVKERNMRLLLESWH